MHDPIAGSAPSVLSNDQNCTSGPVRPNSNGREGHVKDGSQSAIRYFFVFVSRIIFFPRTLASRKTRFLQFSSLNSTIYDRQRLFAYLARRSRGYPMFSVPSLPSPQGTAARSWQVRISATAQGKAYDCTEALASHASKLPSKRFNSPESCI